MTLVGYLLKGRRVGSNIEAWNQDNGRDGTAVLLCLGGCGYL